MKGRVQSICRSSSKRDEGFYRYLKPGALAQLRDSKIIAKSHRPASHSLISLHQLTALSTAMTAAMSSLPSGNNDSMAHQSDGIPSFALMTSHPRCPQRKKLIAVAPIFTESQS